MQADRCPGVAAGSLPVAGSLPGVAVAGSLPEGAVAGSLPEGAVAGSLPEGAVAGTLPGAAAGSHLGADNLPVAAADSQAEGEVLPSDIKAAKPIIE